MTRWMVSGHAVGGPPVPIPNTEGSFAKNAQDFAFLGARLRSVDRLLRVLESRRGAR
jgi:hypothetical protein